MVKKIDKWIQGRYGGYYIWDTDNPNDVLEDFTKMDYGNMVKARKEALKKLKEIM